MRILLSEGSSSSARQVIYGLAKPYRLDLMDPSPWCQCRFSTRVRRRIECPPISEDPYGYARSTLEAIAKYKYDVLFPTHEQVYLFSKFREYFRRHVGLAVPAFDAIERVQSKANFVALMNEIGLPVPESRIAKTREEIGQQPLFPCYIKLAHSTASLGVEKVTNREELSGAIDRFESAGAWKSGEPVVLQSPGIGIQSAATGVFQEGRLVGFACSEILRTGIGGGPALRVSASHPVVREHLAVLGRELHWHGPISIEYFYDTDRHAPQYIEINPRIGETLNFEISGVPVCDAVARIAAGERVEDLPEARPGVVSHNGFIVMIADAYNGATRRDLIKRLWDQLRGRGVFGGYDSELTRPREDPLSLVPAIAVILRLLVAPRSAKELAYSTVDNYSLPHRAATIIDEMHADAFEGLSFG
ncbi:ATP-grasp domain-containing protein [Rhodopirellula sallentina]|uniref:ATP-grasp domain-containing protein n=1 Tax=Rhodopirellula sallentina SM41 TaxID=1263870 RepID=M5U849_9BACT|nr:hypothetical protein [Rhodopirellula sallentina]EMI52128.1 hypothetical protein RSSM_06419 [Rhodopirellula sallentina SM41]